MYTLYRTLLLSLHLFIYLFIYLFIHLLFVHTTQLGTIKEVRLVKNKMGHSKGYAYIEFENEVS